MTGQASLFGAPIPKLAGGAEVLCADASTAIGRAREAGGARLSLVDPPWDRFSQRPGVAAPDESYIVQPLEIIAAHLALIAEASLPDARMAVWHSGALLAEAIREVTRGTPLGKRWAPVLDPPGWELTTSGAWVKPTPEPGVGYHWRGHAEAVLVYVRGTPGRVRAADLRSGYASPPGAHSAKPEEWTEQWIRYWSQPGDLILVPYVGLGGDVRAALRVGERRVIGAELDAKRHAEAIGWIANGRRLA